MIGCVLLNVFIRMRQKETLVSLQTLESCVKNCGSIIHDEIATKEFMEFLKDIAKVF